MEQQLIQYLMSESQGSIKLIVLGVLIAFIVKNLPAIQSFINGFKSPPLTHYLNPNNGSYSSAALMDLEEMKAFQAKGFPRVERKKREKLLKLHDEMEGKYKYESIFACHEFLQFDGDYCEVIIPKYRMLFHYVFLGLACLFFLLSIAIWISIIYLSAVYDMNDSLSLLVFFISFSLTCFFAYQSSPTQQALNIKKGLENINHCNEPRYNSACH